MKHLKRLTVGSAVCLLICGGATGVEAQDVASSFEQLRVLVKPGDKITVVDAAGRQAAARVGTLSRETLTIVTPAGLRALAEADVAEIHQRRGDSLKNGTIIGAVSATAYFVTMGALLAGSDGGDVKLGSAIAGGALFAGVGAAVGAGIDALIMRKQLIYRNGARKTTVVRLSPVFAGGRRGVAVTVKF